MSGRRGGPGGSAAQRRKVVLPGDSAYDYLIVGGGTAGAIVARRLADATDARVALVESGPSDEGVDVILALSRWNELLGHPVYGHDYRIEPQPRGNSDIVHSRGTMLGGCSSHNSCIAFVPPDVDFRRWEAQGASGWGPEGVASWFGRMRERVSLERSDSRHVVVADFIRAATSLGFTERDFRDEAAEGVGWFALNKVGGLRHSSSVAYLHPIAELPANLDVITDTRVMRIRFDGLRALGVETSRGFMPVAEEVVLCAGTFNTPKLLQLSGVGSADQLRAMDLDVVADVPAVGEHLQDHPEGVILWEATRAVPPESTQRYEAGLFATIDADAPWPDLMLHLGTEAFDMHTVGHGYPTAAHAFSLTPNVTRAKSEGFVRLRSADPADDPIIDFRYFQDPEGYDERIMAEGIRLARELAATEPLASWVRDELAPGPMAQTFDEISAYVRTTANTVYHPVGTCRMGAVEDDAAVVDPSLHVRGLDNVRVADASIFPSIVSTNPSLTCMMIGEKCAGLVLRERS